MWDAANACLKAGVVIPKEIQKYFSLDGDEDRVLELKNVYEDELLTFSLDGKPGVSDYSDDMQEGYEIDLKKLPKDVTKIRVYNSY